MASSCSAEQVQELEGTLSLHPPLPFCLGLVWGQHTEAILLSAIVGFAEGVWGQNMAADWGQGACFAVRKGS